ncbi:hypothetical protein UA08_01496 [Talaromyces atroroseus]|uniref:Centromere protein H C-terminal domain-containing protein n=1 Tax=Talaromyces atroroseus TaxID=1441469 RepID=A0A1Q5QB96_TALAT|nr:hypothetical protein UA08_01496 [Talaromyces atroroseus]OKL63088.1 hypothetical protein UA08_01496 [Talaromyces atroroseus]
MPPSMASNDGNQIGLTEAESALLDLAADDRREVLSLSSKEELVLRLYDQIQELDLERAILEQDPEQPNTENAEEQLPTAERELLEARATYTVRRKAIESTLMTDPILKAVHLRAASPAERYLPSQGLDTFTRQSRLYVCFTGRALLPLVNRRDVLSLVYENLANTRSAALETLSNTEVENLRLIDKNRELASQLLELTAQETSWRDRVDDGALLARIEATEEEYKKTRAQRDTVKSVVSAMVVGSGVDWARDDRLRGLVLDELV